MKTLYTALAAGLLSATAVPALAQSETDMSSVTCAQFMAMDSEGQMAAVEAMHSAAMDMSADTMASGNGDSVTPGNEENASEGEMAEENAMANADSGSSTSEGAMSADTSALPGTAENASEGEMAEENATPEHMAMTLSEACDGNPDMMAMDAMKSDM